MKKFYKGQRNLISGENYYTVNLPSGIIFDALFVSQSGIVFFKTEVTEVEHNEIINLGNVEILFENVISEAISLFSDLFIEEEIIEWRDS